MTTSANGSSQSTDTEQAILEALQQARAALQTTPQFGLIFASAKHDLALTLSKARQLCPGTAFAACHTAGEYTEKGLTHGGLVVLLVASPDMLCRSAFASNLQDVEGAARSLTQGYTGLVDEARTQGLGLSSTILLLDGLVGTGDQLVNAVQRNTRMFQSIVGGAAGDDGAFHRPWVGTDQGVEPCGAAAIHICHRTPWGVGIGHGLKPQTNPMKVTRAAGNVVYEIEGRPAFETYRDYARQRGVELTPQDSKYLIENELGVMLLNRLHHARAPVRVGGDGSLHLVAEIPTGAKVCILDGESDAMVAACKGAAEAALEALGGSKASCVVVFDCVCRGAILGDRFQKEIEAVTSVFPGLPVVGFLTYGEIARTGGSLDGWHNTTSVVVAIPA